MLRKLVRLGVGACVITLMTMSAVPSADAAPGDSLVAVVQGRVDGGGIQPLPAATCSTFTGAILTGTFVDQTPGGGALPAFAGSVGLSGGNINACEFGNTAFGIGLEHPPGAAVPAGGIMPDGFTGSSADTGNCVGGVIEGDYVRAGIIAVALIDVDYNIQASGCTATAGSANVEAVAVVAAVPGAHPAAPGNPAVTLAAGPVVGTDLPVGWEPPL